MTPSADHRPPATLTLTALPEMPLVRSGDDLVAHILRSLEQAALALMDGDILVIAQKIVSKSEGRYVKLEDVQPSQRACRNRTTESWRLVRRVPASGGLYDCERNQGMSSNEP